MPTTEAGVMLATHDGFLYFAGPGGDVYRAREGGPIDTNGWPTGSRFQCTKASWPLCKRVLGID